MIHIVTGEYPPTHGGVGDYTAQVARALTAAGEEVHVWCPGENTTRSESGATIHRVSGTFRPRDLYALDRALNTFPQPRRLLVQWVPHSFGYRSLNALFALWLWKRAKVDGDTLQLMVHEPFVAFEGSLRQRLAAAVHRAMAIVLLDAATHVWISITAWERSLRHFCLRNSPVFSWRPVPTNIPKFALTARQHAASRIGHFGTFGDSITRLLESAILKILAASDASILLIGLGSGNYLAAFLGRHPEACTRISATGHQPPAALARLLSSCDLMLQPYPDGLSTRRGTVMAALALGVPLVSNLGHLSETFWSTSPAARLASGPEGCSWLVLELLRDAPLRLRTAAAAQALYDARFDVRHTVAALLPSVHRKLTRRATA